MNDLHPPTPKIVQDWGLWHLPLHNGTFIKLHSLPEGLVYLENRGHKSHIAKRHTLEERNAFDVPWKKTESTLCQREAKRPNSKKSAVSLDYMCTDCLKKLNEILSECFYDPEKEKYYHPLKDFTEP